MGKDAKHRKKFPAPIPAVRLLAALPLTAPAGIRSRKRMQEPRRTAVDRIGSAPRNEIPHMTNTYQKGNTHMKRMQKLLALILALCFLAVIPLTAAAEDERYTLPLGYWTVFDGYNSNTGKGEKVSLGYSSLTVNADGTCSFMLSSFVVNGTWDWVENDSISFGYTYKMHLMIDGQVTDHYFYFVTEPGLYGNILIKIGDVIYTYSK